MNMISFVECRGIYLVYDHAWGPEKIISHESKDLELPSVEADSRMHTSVSATAIWLALHQRPPYLGTISVGQIATCQACPSLRSSSDVQYMVVAHVQPQTARIVSDSNRTPSNGYLPS